MKHTFKSLLAAAAIVVASPALAQAPQFPTYHQGPGVGGHHHYYYPPPAPAPYMQPPVYYGPGYPRPYGYPYPWTTNCYWVGFIWTCR